MEENKEHEENIESEFDEDWAIYLTILNNDQIASILVDLNFVQIAPIENTSELIVISILMNMPNEDGLLSSEESDIINQIEDEIISFLKETVNAVYVGRVNSEGKIRSYFYTNKAEINLQDISNAIDKYTQRKVEIKYVEDTEWSSYFEILYPRPVEMQRIQNNKVIMNLESYGDTLEKERAVDHWIYFKTENDREQFLNEIKDNGFEIVEKGNTDNDELKFSLQLSRIDKVDYQSVDDYVLYLWETSQYFDGDYDGWETLVIND